MAAWPDGRRHRKTYAKGRLDGGFGRRKARQKRFAGSNDDRRLVFGGECVDGILPGEKGDLYDLYPEGGQEARWAARYCWGDCPVQRRKARVKEADSE